MKQLIGKKSLWPTLGGLALVAALVGGMLLGGAAPALAAGPDVPPGQAGADQRPAFYLELAYQRLTLAADVQAVQLDHAGDLATRAQAWIDYLAGQGQDVAGLQAALDAFKDAASQAQSSYEKAKAVLNVHAGFDDQGRVTDREQAAQTLRQAGGPLGEARRSLRQGTAQLRRALGEFRRQQRPQPATS
jgi:hypothetical protein